MRAGLRGQTLALHEQLSKRPGPWWFAALLALFGAFESANSFRRIGDSGGWTVVALTFFGVCGFLWMLAMGTAAVIKFRDPARRTGSDSAPL
jgi:hypothetical protein